MRKLLLLICIGILLQADNAMAHAYGLDSCKVPLTVLSGNVECSLIDFQSDTIECKIVKFSHITDTFQGVPPKYHLKLSMTLLCLKNEKCRQAFDCEEGAATDGDGCHTDPLTGEYHCH